jgi:hypothetical protein
MKSSFHSLIIPFLPLFCSCQLNSIPLLPSSCPGRLASGNSTNSSQLNSSLYTLCTDHAENSLFIVGKVLHNNGSYSIVAYYRGNVFTESLPINEHLIWLHYSGLRASCRIMALSPCLKVLTNMCHSVKRWIITESRARLICASPNSICINL